MRKRASVLPAVAAAVALQLLLPAASIAADGDEAASPARQEGEQRWVPSLTITSGVTFERQEGYANSVLLQDMTPPPVPIRGAISGDDRAVSPFVGGSLELMTPALPLPARPRLFVSGEILPTFAADRDVALEGDPGCVRGPEPDAPCAVEEVPGARDTKFGEEAANGQGTSTTATVDTLVFGASFGVSFPVRIGKRQLRIKPSIGWINYKVETEGLVVDAECNPPDRCTDVTRRFTNPFPPPPTFDIVEPGFLRETILTASDSKRFNGFGPGLDIEMDTGRFGPLGVSLFLGARAYYVAGNRTIAFGGSQTYVDELRDPPGGPVVLTNDLATAQFEVEVDPWIYRAHVGIRLQWLGGR